MHAFEVKKYIPVVFQVAGLVWSCGLCVRFAGCWFVACMVWVTEGQLKKRVRVIWALFGNQFACLVEGLDVELLERE